MDLPHEVTRTIVIDAAPETIFRFFTDPARWAAWWGEGSTIDPRVGGAIRIRHGNGFVSEGQVLESVPPLKFVFTFSLQAATLVPAEASRVTLTLAERATQTAVTVTHALADQAVRDLMPQGWRYHLSTLANAVANEVYADADAMADSWFALWTQPDGGARSAGLRAIAHEGVRFHDRYSALEGVQDVVEQLGAIQRFMPGLRIERRGPVRHCQGTMLAEWAAVGADGTDVMAGTNVFTCRDGRLISVTSVSR